MEARRDGWPGHATIITCRLGRSNRLRAVLRPGFLGQVVVGEFGPQTPRALSGGLPCAHARPAGRGASRTPACSRPPPAQARCAHPGPPGEAWVGLGFDVGCGACCCCWCRSRRCLSALCASEHAYARILRMPSVLRRLCGDGCNTSMTTGTTSITCITSITQQHNHEKKRHHHEQEAAPGRIASTSMQASSQRASGRRHHNKLQPASQRRLSCIAKSSRPHHHKQQAAAPPQAGSTTTSRQHHHKQQATPR